ncbi:DUF3575 domain-containing protein [Winogradskyella haliclonae]|uniref:Outer membrane protein beta-barrel domain-containing protein n=1 Tax=Winogradskyella haliclonae TaxID=2048558 RepID=A0ABQ2BWW1_9FLAO|nr:DUF3575 domain-containing protein [Winogradskyella haliclonae]GGI56989.1 hypothetical protein GCM10011444_12980 [Winogradskyella haliclonae]
MKFVKSSLLILTTLVCVYANSQIADSNSIAFRKGRWFTGLSGSISSTTIRINSLDQETSTNNYGINIQSGKFLKDRFLVGGRLQINRINTSGNVDQQTETLFIGPFSNYYFNVNKTGGLFITAAVGYTRYSNEVDFTQNLMTVNEFSEGSGLGSIFSLGYSYTITDNVAFDLGINVNLFWLDVEQESIPSNVKTNYSISSNDISLSFGFNILLDDFFF